MNTAFDDTLLIKFFLKESTEEENQCIYEWLLASSDHKKEFNRLKFIWHFSAYKYLYQQINTSEELESIKTEIYRRKARWEKIRTACYTALATAAVVSLVLIFAILRPSPLMSPETMADSREESTEIFIPKGMEGAVTLADGTRVWLNSGSRILYPEDYREDNRKIYLDGEAYFEVKSDKKHPFTVETSNLSILVTGTRFNLSSYQEDNTIEATLCQGCITLCRHDDKTGDNKIQLRPNDKITYKKDNGEIRKDIVDGQSATLWKDGILSFKEVPLREIVKKLERKFNTSISICNPKIGDYIYTATFEKEKGLQTILDIIATSAPISYQIESDGSVSIQ